ncbi:MAG: LPXTG cell wall anchor domain-containing protein, partial [Dermatophilaceae bacterium]
CTITNDDQVAHLTLVKQVTNDNGGTALPTAWTLTATGQPPTTTTITGVTGNPAVTGATVPAGNYALSESGGPPGYTAGSWSCPDATLTGSTVTVPNGGNVTCTINNDDQSATLTLVKTVTNDNGGTAVATDWTLTATGQPPTTTTITGVTGNPAVTGATVPAGNYALSESGGPPGYTAGSWSCPDATLTGSTVTVPSGGAVTCTIHNDDQPAALTLVKQVRNDNGGTAVPTDWTLAADGPTSGIQGPTGTPEVTNVVVDAGDYDLSESGGPDGYTAGDWNCTSGTLDGATVTVPNGAEIICTIINDDEPGTFAVTKGSNPASGSTVEPGDVITYTVTATKTGGVDPSVVVVDDLSEVFDNATLVPGSITATAGTADVSGDQLTWIISALSEEETVSYQVRVNDGAYGVRLTNVVTSEGSETCAPPGGLAARLVRPLALALQEPEADCSTTHVTPLWTLDKSSNPASGSTVDPGSTIAYTLTVTNVSEGVVSNAIVTDDLSQVLAHGSLVSVPSGATLQGTTLTWAVPTLEPGQSTTLTYSVRLNADAVDVTVGNVATPGAGGECDPGCSTTHQTPPNGTTPQPELPNTGTTVGWLLRVGFVLILIGGGAVLLARRSTRARP